MSSRATLLTILNGLLRANSTNVTNKDIQIMGFDSNFRELVFEGAIEEKVNQSAKRDELSIYRVLFQQ